MTGDIARTKRTDPTIDSDWGTNPPTGTAVGADNFSSVWDGNYTADFTGPTTFFTSTDDGGQLFLDLNQNGTFEFDPAGAVIFRDRPDSELIIIAQVDQGAGTHDRVTVPGHGSDPGECDGSVTVMQARDSHRIQLKIGGTRQSSSRAR